MEFANAPWAKAGSDRCVAFGDLVSTRIHQMAHGSLTKCNIALASPAPSGSHILRQSRIKQTLPVSSNHTIQHSGNSTTSYNRMLNEIFLDFGGLPLQWSIIEPCMGISCACLSTLRPLYRVLHDSIQRLRASSSKLLTTQRSIFHSATQKVSISGIGKSIKHWGVRSQKEPPGTDDAAVAVKGSSRIEMRSMGYSTLGTD